MNGAESLVATLRDSGVEICFANPGTTEIAMVTALDTVPGMRGVLTLFEGVATGAADGYGRMAGKPAAVLLHLGPGLANGIANLHNARRAQTPMLVLVGQHPARHIPYGPPLAMDIESLARPVSKWLRSSAQAGSPGEDAREALMAAQTRPFGIATLIVPSDIADADASAGRVLLPPSATHDEQAIATARAALQGARAPVLFLGGDGLSPAGLKAAARIAAATSARLLCESFSARMRRGADMPAIERLAYFPEQALAQLAGADVIVLAGAAPPAAFFAYPGLPSALWPDKARLLALAPETADPCEALIALASDLRAPDPPQRTQAPAIDLPRGALNAKSIAVAIALSLPENAIVVDEGLSSSPAIFAQTAQSAPHDMLMLTGGSIGQGLPAAVGAAIACPARKVICLQADGSASYTLQALWTMARERLDIVIVLFSNRSYAILNFEMHRAGITPGPQAKALFNLDNPPADWVSLARGFGVSAARATSAETFAAEFSAALAAKGPHLIEAVI